MTTPRETIAPFGGFGLGLRRTHYDDFLSGHVAVDFVEVISENYMIEGGRQLRILEQVRASLPVIAHGVSMSIGSAGGLDRDHLARLKILEQRIDPLFVSDHLCWTRTSAHNSHDLLPMPLTRDALDVVCDNIDDCAGRKWVRVRLCKAQITQRAIFTCLHLRASSSDCRSCQTVSRR